MPTKPIPTEFQLWNKYVSQYKDNGKGDRSHWQQHQKKTKGKECERGSTKQWQAKRYWGGGAEQADQDKKNKKNNTYSFFVVCLCGGFERAVSWTTKNKKKDG